MLFFAFKEAICSEFDCHFLMGLLTHSFEDTKIFKIICFCMNLCIEFEFGYAIKCRKKMLCLYTNAGDL